MAAPGSGQRVPRVSVIVPARNEESSLGACLESVLQQQGVEFEVLVVDDGSRDRTRAIAESFPVRVLDAAPLLPPATGKCNALATAARAARGTWLLFTDADTMHRPGSLEGALREAEDHGAALLSYSPEQEVHGVLEKAVMPVVFAELAATYRPAEVCDPDLPAAAANGQYLLVRRDAYEAVGGHGAVSSCLLEDVELARRLKRAGYRLRFRYGADAVRTRMYRSFAQLAEGWTKNLALLFPSPERLAARRLAEFLAMAGGSTVLAGAAVSARPRTAAAGGMVAAAAWWNFQRRIRRAHFRWDANLAAVFGLPLFAWLLWRSARSHRHGAVQWKGRLYGGTRRVAAHQARDEELPPAMSAAHP
jgi:cellulose synthase/poly-beta-1,6-N-acetylglucosamine synthase-like glycosyltransferase